ncbi:hypothetical protein Cs7R123_13840 [Catellatospora sp. TT07R-123]|uniref:hypothetical protein n=1 Tax=Catellatospora sp. TT07R-123 TaxID=2733863 RepID=UPI001B1DFAB0|nr:hypothetical protein [Catellatospora sp. TT07R-123]GHJ44042.1 hypothetical protein Cs7R123_13840 [Catellatospora sp. TT07R-123]
MTAPEQVQRWQHALAQAQRLAAGADHAASSTLLREVLTELSWADAVPGGLAAAVHGLAGANALHLGQYAAAVTHTEQALRLCETAGDSAGAAIYTGNLELARLAEGAGRGDPASLRAIDVRRRVADAQDLSDGGRYSASNGVLRGLLADAAPETVRHLAKVYGLLGLNLYRLGQLDAARTHTEAALAQCRRTGDADGIRIYTANLAVIG